MSDSPFADNANALLTFKVSTGLYTQDETTGNQIEIVGAIEVKAMLSRPTTNPRNLEVMGSDRSQLLLKGRAVDPQYLPNSIQTGARAVCALVDLFTGTEQIGEFEVISVMQSQFAAVTDVLGSYIEGYFRIDNAGGIVHET